MNFMKLTAAGFAAILLVGCGKTDTGSSEDEYAEVTVTAGQEPSTEAERRKRTLTVDLSESGDKRVLSASLTGSIGKKVRLYESGSVLHRDLVGAFGQAVSVQGYLSDGAVIEFEFDPDNMKSVPQENLILLYYNEVTNDLYEEIPAELEIDNHTIKAKISGEGDYMLADGYEWYRAWGADLSRFTSHETVLRNDDYGFEMTLPSEIELHMGGYDYNDPDDPVTALPVCYGGNDDKTVQISIDYIEYPGCVSAESYISELADAVVQYLNQEVSLGSFECADGQTAWYYTYEGDPQYGMHLGVQCAYPITDTQYIKVYFSYDDEEWLEKAMGSIKTFCFYDKKIPETAGKTEGEPEVFVPAAAPKDITFTLPENVTAEPCVELLSDDAADLFRLDFSGAEDITAISITATESGWIASTEIGHYMDFCEQRDGWDIIDTFDKKLSNGGSGCIAASTEEAGGYFFMGAFDTGNNQIVKVTAMLKEGASQETYDDVLQFVKSIDVS